MKARVPERVEQAHIVTLLRSFGGHVYVLGTHRRATDFHGTMQTPGLPDVQAFLPRPETPGRWRFVVVECKAKGGRLRPEQRAFRELAIGADVAHIVGGLDAVIAWLVETGYASAHQFPHYRQPATARGESR